MKSLTVRNLDDQVMARLAELAAANHRNVEAHVRFLIEREVAATPAETAGELADRVWTDAAPEVDLKAINRYVASRGRRSNRRS